MKQVMEGVTLDKYLKRATEGQMTTVPVEALKLWDKNPRFASDKELKRLRRNIERLGFYKPLLVIEDGTVIGGNQRLKVLRQMGEKEVAVMLLTFEEVEGGVRVLINGRKQKTVFNDRTAAMVEYAISDNDSHGEWDPMELAPLAKLHLDPVIAQDYRYGLGKTQSTKDLISKYGPAAEAKEVPRVPLGDPVSQAGEVYQLGDHLLLCGDATKKASYDTLLADRTVACVVTDPPYNMAYEGGAANKRQPIEGDNQETGAFYQFLFDALLEMMSRTDGGFYVFMGPAHIGTLQQAFKGAGGHYQGTIVWAKNTFTLSGSDWQHQYENILYGWPARVKHHYYAGFRDQGDVWPDPDPGAIEVKEGNTIITVGDTKVRILDHELEATDFQVGKFKGKTDVWLEKKPVRSEHHSTMKPVSLITKALKASSKTGDWVLDPFGGSGTTLLGAEMTDRKCAMMEIDPRYCDVIRQRYALYIGEETKWQEATPTR